MPTRTTIAVTTDVKERFNEARNHTELTQSEFIEELLDGGVTVEELNVVPVEEVRADE